MTPGLQTSCFVFLSEVKWKILPIKKMTLHEKKTSNGTVRIFNIDSICIPLAIPRYYCFSILV